MSEDHFYKGIFDSFLQIIEENEQKTELSYLIQKFFRRKEIDIEKNDFLKIKEIIKNDDLFLGKMFLIRGIILKEENS